MSHRQRVWIVELLACGAGTLAAVLLIFIVTYQVLIAIAEATL